MANPMKGSSSCTKANTPIIRRFPPEARATASVVTVGHRPAPINTVGRYCPTDTAKPTALATSAGFNNIGKRTFQNVLLGLAPRPWAIEAYRLSMPARDRIRTKRHRVKQKPGGQIPTLPSWHRHQFQEKISAIQIRNSPAAQSTANTKTKAPGPSCAMGSGLPFKTSKR